MAKGLGKGLGALMGDFTVETPSAKSPYQMLPIHKVEPNPGQPRQDFDEEELEADLDIEQANSLWKWSMSDWYNIDTGELLTGYEPASKLVDLLSHSED